MTLLTSTSEINQTLQAIYEKTEHTSNFNITCTKKWDGDAAILELHYPAYVQEFKVDGPISYKQDAHSWYIQLPREPLRRIHPETFVHKQLESEAKRLIDKIDPNYKVEYYHIFAFRVEVMLNQCGPFRARNFLSALRKEKFLSRNNKENHNDKKVQEERKKVQDKLKVFNTEYGNQYAHFVILDEVTKAYTKQARDFHELMLARVNAHVFPKKHKMDIVYWALSENKGNQMKLSKSSTWGDGFQANYAQRMINLHNLFRAGSGRTDTRYVVSNLTYRMLFVTPLVHLQSGDDPLTVIPHNQLKNQSQYVIRFLEERNAETAVEGCVVSIECERGKTWCCKVKVRTVLAMPNEILVDYIEEVKKTMNWKEHTNMLLPASEILFICFGNSWMESEIEKRKQLNEHFKTKKRPASLNLPIGWDIKIAKQYDAIQHKTNLDFKKQFGEMAAGKMQRHCGITVTDLNYLRLRKMAGLQTVNISRVTQISEHDVDCNLVRFYGPEGFLKAQKLFASYTHRNAVTSIAEHGPPPLHRETAEKIEYTSPMPRDRNVVSKDYDAMKFIPVANKQCYVEQFDRYPNLKSASTNPFWQDFFRLQFIFRYLLQYPERTQQWWPFLSLPMKQWVLNHVRNKKIYSLQRKDGQNRWLPVYFERSTELFSSITDRFEQYTDNLPPKKIDKLWFAHNQLPSPSQSMFHDILLELFPKNSTGQPLNPEEMWRQVWQIILQHNENWTGDNQSKVKLREDIENVFKSPFIDNYTTFQGIAMIEFADYNSLLTRFAVSRHPMFYAENGTPGVKFEKRLHAFQSSFQATTTHRNQNYLQYVHMEDFEKYFNLKTFEN